MAFIKRFVELVTTHPASKWLDPNVVFDHIGSSVQHSAIDAVPR